MINKMKMRTGGGNKTRTSANYLLKTNPEGDAIDCTIPRLDGESNMEYATRIKTIFESARVPNQKNLYQFNALSLHPSEGGKFTDEQMIEMAKEVYLYNGVKNSFNDNRHYMFVVERDKNHHHVHAMIHLTDLETKKVNNKMIDYNPIIKKLELKYGLYNEHRKPKDEDEYKKAFKKELKTILDNALSPSEFLMLANGAGFEINHNGNEAYSLTKDDQTFKASDLGMSYKLLKKALGDDPEFAATLASLHNKKAGNGGYGSIGGDFHDEQSAITERRIKSNRVLDTRFDSSNDHDFFFKGTNKKAFEYSHSRGRVDFNNTSPMAIKAGLQKLTENLKPQDLKVNGPEYAKRGIWLQFHMMNLDQKGFSISGFTPTANDKAQLAKMKLENPAFKKPDEAISAPKNVTATPAVAGKSDRVSHTDLESFTKFKVADTQLQPKTKAQSAAQSGAAGLLAGTVEKLTDMSGSFSGNLMSEKLSEMSSLNTEIKNKRESAENQQHQEKRHRLQKLKPT